MNPQTVETIIVGAGVAGLGCAHQLAKHKRDFLVITENIGGRIATSDDGRINYGAYFVLSNYKHILSFVKKGEKLHPFSVEFHDKRNQYYHLAKMCRYPIQTLRLLFMLWRFKSAYEQFKKQCERSSQKFVIESDPKLKKLYIQSASEFIKEKKITGIANKFLSEGIYMCTFLPLSKVSAFDFMRLCLGLILPAYEFTFLPDKATKGFQDKIKNDSVTLIKDGEIQTKNGQAYKTRHIVVATPAHTAKKLLGLKKLKAGSNSYVFHVSGELRDRWKGGQFELFNSSSDVIFIRKQVDGSYIFYSKTVNPKLENYFVNPKVVFEKHWEPAFNITGDELLECEQGKNIYLAGDHNVIGLEDSYITGMLAANKIIMNNKLENALKWIVPVFGKHNVPFQITGGFAANIYGAKRPVNDIDIDVPEDKMDILLPDIEPYITFGPAHCKDERLDVKLIKLNYKSQEIDIGGAFDVKIFDDQNKVWIHCPAKFETAQIHSIYGIQVPIVSPQDLIEYKKLLSGEHQKTDITAVQKYIAKNK